EYRPAHTIISRLRSRCAAESGSPEASKYHHSEISDIERVVFRQWRHRKVVPSHGVERNKGPRRAVRAHVWAIIAPNSIDQIACRARLMIAVTHDQDWLVREAALDLVHEEVAVEASHRCPAQIFAHLRRGARAAARHIYFGHIRAVIGTMRRHGLDIDEERPI